MRKIFVILGATTLCACVFSCGSITYKLVKAEESETSEVESVEESNEESEEVSEDETINVDDEVSQLSQVAKDTIEVIKTFLSQPLVIGGVSTTLGAILLWLLCKGLGYVVGKRNGKYDKKIADLLKQLGLDEDKIKELIEFKDNVYEVLEVIVENTKNEKTREQAKKLLNKMKNGEQVIDNSKEELGKALAEVEQEANILNDKEAKIKDILEK